MHFKQSIGYLESQDGRDSNCLVVEAVGGAILNWFNGERAVAIEFQEVLVHPQEQEPHWTGNGFTVFSFQLIYP